jgi:hypothetical protein
VELQLSKPLEVNLCGYYSTAKTMTAYSPSQFCLTFKSEFSQCVCIQNIIAKKISNASHLDHKQGDSKKTDNQI